jgi:hypothetical protein
MPGLKRLIKEARELQKLVDEERDKTLPELAAQVNYTPSRFSRVLRLNYLAPDIITGLIDGTQPQGLTRRELVHASLPMDWALQRKLLGFPGRPGLNGQNSCGAVGYCATRRKMCCSIILHSCWSFLQLEFLLVLPHP